MNGTPVLELRPFTRADMDRLIGWLPEPRLLHQWTGPTFSHPLDKEQLTRHLAEAGGLRPTLLVYKAVEKSTGRTIGHGEIAVIDHQNRSATLARILVGPLDLRGCGLGGQIVRRLLWIAFSELNLHRVDLRVFDFNQAAILCYEKAGFRREGLMRDLRRFGDEYWSVCLMSILEDEWRGGPAWNHS
ncbi:MAG: GNAT family protein [Thermodesulfobacteriota bacterium]